MNAVSAMDSPAPRLPGDETFTHLHFVIVFVRDQERSLRFYLDQLGFTLVIDAQLESGERWVELAPPDGLARICLATPKSGSDEEKLIGRFTGILFLTADVQRTFEEWQGRGVKFHSAPQQPVLGVMATRFDDLDGNSFGLAGVDEVTKQVEVKRRLAAEKAEAERRTAQELDIAKQVQARLFPQILPARRTLDYAGVCIQARQVGGDYYDFLDFDGHRLGILIADISGKGIGAALLMASMQANLRSQFATSGSDPGRLLRSANRIFHENTRDAAYATLFFSEYDEAESQLTFINCGHLPALLLHSDNTIEWLTATATVFGLFKQWDCASETRQFLPGDILVLYTDGVSEASNANQEDFGPDRIVEIVQQNRARSAQEIVSALVENVRNFSVGEQADDITVVVVKRI